MKIYLKKPDGKTITLEKVESSGTINMLKAKIELEVKIPLDEQKLFLEGRPTELVGDKILKECDIQKKSTVNLKLVSHPVVVKKSNGKTINLEVKYSDTIGDLKAKVQSREKFLPDDQMLLLPGRRSVLDVNATLKSIRYSTVELKLRSGRVIVKRLNGTSINLEEVKSSDTIYMLKAMVQDSLGFPPADQRLFFEERKLDDTRTLAYYKIQRESTVHLKLRQPIVYVKKPNGKTIALEVKSSDTIEKLKAMVQKKEGFLPEEQMLFFKDKEKEFENTRKLEYYHIENESTVKLELRSHRVFVKKQNGGVIFLEVKSSDTIYILKAKVLDREGFHPDKQRLFLPGTGKQNELDDKMTLASYKIRSKSTVDLVVKED